MPSPYPEEFRANVVRVARNRGPGVPIEQAAADFGVDAVTLSKWMRRADIDAGVKPGTTTQENAELRIARQRIKLLEQENEVLRRSGPQLTCRRPICRYNRWWSVFGKRRGRSRRTRQCLQLISGGGPRS
ncbi:transposase [Streptomyces sp. NPDC021356]|uniref:transposase n=1 Tax=Streptomyces sp. NPDC021356 TaxID=3154900 RepID=UPI0033D3B768